jgi:toxin ParE1/3/4
MKLRVARSAVRDLDVIWAYIAVEQSLEMAERVVSSLASVFSFLGKSPSAGRSRPELGEGLRSFPSGNYRIYYRQDTRGVVRVLHVRHAARDEKKLFG